MININMKSKYLKMIENKEDKEEEHDCMFCFCNIDIKKKYIKCVTCNTDFHYKCYMDWKKQKNNEKMKCIHCNQNTLYKYFNNYGCILTRLFGPNFVYRPFK